MRRRILSAVAAVLVAATAAWGLEDDLSDFTFKNMVDGYAGSALRLYPELDLYGNPSVAVALEQVILFPTLSLGLGSSRDVETIATGEPNAGATRTTTARTIGLYPVGAEILVPLEGGIVVGGSIYGGIDADSDKEVDDGYTTADETIITTDRDTRNLLSGSALFATALDELDVGARAFFTRRADPATEEFDQVSGNPAAADETYTTEGGTAVGDRKYREVETTFGGALGAGLESDDLRVGLGVAASHRIDDSSTGYVGVDQNGNGFDDTIVTVEQQQTSTEPWGGGLSHYDYLSRTTTSWIGVQPHALYRVDERLTAIGSGYWLPVARDVFTEYERTDPANENVYRETVRSGLASFGLLGGVRWDRWSRLSLRSGIGYELARSTFAWEILDAAGASLFDANNTDNYPEVSYGVDGEPEDDEVIADAGTRADGTPAWSVARTNRISLLTGAMWNPAAGVRVYSDGELNVSFGRQIYRVFNVDDDTVWSEEDPGSDLDWTLNALIGLAFDVGETLTLGFETGAILSTGTAGSYRDPLPTSTGGATTTPVDDVEEGRSRAFTLDVDVVVGL